MAMPPPPPDRAAFEPRPPSLPARGFAIGVAVAGVATSLLVAHVGPLLHGLSLEDSIKGIQAPLYLFHVLPAIGGLAGGWLGWRWFTRGLPVSLPRALGVAAATTLLSLLIGCIVGGVALGSVLLVGGLLAGDGKVILSALGVIFGAIIIGPLFAIWLFGPVLAALVIPWTLVWRYRVNRRAH